MGPDRQLQSADQDAEARRNALLRRGDWRFLLPWPQPRHGVCFAAGPLADAVALIADRVSPPERLASAEQCDLAVATNPDGTLLQVAFHSLEPGGACYTEWRRTPWQTVAAVRQRLERAGFERVVCYTTRPDPDVASPAVWCPLDSDAALEHLLADAPRPSTMSGRVRRTLRRAFWRAAPQLRSAPTICAVARRPAVHREAARAQRSTAVGSGTRAPGGALSDELAAVIERGWSSWGLGPMPERLGWTLLTGGRQSINKVVALGYADRDPAPRLAVKMARVPESHAPLRNEARALEGVHALGLDGHGIPRLLFSCTAGGVLAVGQTAIHGRPLSRVMRTDDPRALATTATEWLAGLAVGCPPQPLEERLRRIVDPVRADFTAAFGAVVDGGMLREAGRALETLGALAVVPEQRDFAPWNLLVTDGGLGVLDWESAELKGLPLLDLIYFLSYFAFYRAGAGDLAAYRRTYRATRDPSTSAGELTAACIARYVQRLGVPRSAVRPLRLLTWMLHSRSEFRQFTAQAGARPGPDLLRRSVFLALWEEELCRDRIG